MILIKYAVLIERRKTTINRFKVSCKNLNINVENILYFPKKTKQVLLGFFFVSIIIIIIIVKRINYKLKYLYSGLSGN